MKVNMMKVVTEYTCEVKAAIAAKIEAAETYEAARKNANYVLGLVDGMIILTNAIVCAENNEFTREMSDVEDGWKADIYQALADVARRTRQPNDEIMQLLRRRDEQTA